MKPKNKKAYYLFSPWLRMFHWIMVISILTLFFTGLYIGDPGFSGFAGESPTVQVGNWFSMEMFRRTHFIVGWIFISAFILRFYGFYKNKGDRLLPRPNQKIYWYGLVDTLKHYLFIPQKREGEYLRNSLARTAYFGVYILLFLEIITGVSMFSIIQPNSFLGTICAPVINFIGTYNLHMIHHYIAWMLIVFAITHVYLSFREDIVSKNGEVSSMISGRKYYAEDPEDVGDIK